MKLKLFMSEKCPDCVEAIEILKNANIDYQEINITDSMKNLKEFLLIEIIEKNLNQLLRITK